MRIGIRISKRLGLAMLAASAAAAWSGVAMAAPVVFTGSGTAGVTTAIAAFEAAIGGANNGGGPPTTNGFRTINWDGVALDGTDFGGNTTVIVPGGVVGIPVNRFAARGVTFAEVYAVSGDGWVTVNDNVGGQFPPFSPTKTFAMFNDNGIEFQFNVPADSLTPAKSRGFGAVFIDVENPNTTSIEYKDGSTSLGKFFAPTAGSGEPSFLGVLFDTPVVTNVDMVLGQATLFHFENGTITSGPPDLPTGEEDLVVTDDFIYPEPQVNLHAPCVPSNSVLCVDDHQGDQRYRIATTFTTTEGHQHSGVGGAVPLDSLGVNIGGLFWFFQSNNPEILVKVIDACSSTNSQWVFFSAGTNVGFSLSVVDTQLGLQHTYTNADIHAADPVQDTEALACH